MVKQGNCKTFVRLGSKFVDYGASQLPVCLTVVINLHEYEVVLVIQVVFVVPPFRVVFLELEFTLWDDSSDEGDLA